MATTVPSASALALAGCMAFLSLDATAEVSLPKPVQPVPSPAQHVARDAGMDFDLRAQPLQSALDAYGALTGWSGLYAAESVAGRDASAVRGRYTPDEALRMLLAGTGLQVHYTAADAFVLEPGAPVRAAAAEEAAPARTQGHDDGLVQSRVRDAFCGDPRLAAGDFRIAVSFRLDATGHVEQPVLLGSTGDAARDGAVLGALRQVQLGQPPAERARAPFVMLVLPPSQGPAWHCDAGRGAAP
jgi:hypothetical protein